MMPKTIYVIGELNVDAILSGVDVTPEPNQEKIVENFEVTLGSSSAITAGRLAQLGMNVKFVSVVGRDQFGEYCTARLKELGVHTEHVVSIEDEKTGITVSLSNPANRSLLTYMGTISKVNPSIIPAELFTEAEHIHFGSYFLQEGMQLHWQSIFMKAKQKGITTSFDTGWDPKEQWHRRNIDQLLTYTDLFMPSETEIEHIYKLSDFEELSDVLKKERGKVIIKRGKKGSSLLNQENQWIHAAPFEVEPLDTTGAGDSFNAGLIYAFISGKADKEMLAFANACGAISTLSIGGTGGEINLSMIKRFMKTDTD